jgi:hypothetical protein
MQKMGSLSATTTAVTAATADVGQQALQELLPELLIVCLSHGAHANHVPGIRTRYDVVSSPAHGPFSPAAAYRRF